MQFKFAAILIRPLCLLTVPLIAQEGHPLVGSWRGDWGPNAKDRTDVTFILNYDGNNIVGMINPGPDVAKLQTPLWTQAIGESIWKRT
jgi:hypothetical protein